MLFITLEGLLPARNNNLVYVTMKYPSMSMGLVIVGFKYIVSLLIKRTAAVKCFVQTYPLRQSLCLFAFIMFR